MFRGSLSSWFLDIQRPGKFDIDFNSHRRILKRKDSQGLRFLIEAFENPKILKIIRLPFSDLISFEFFEKL